MGNTCDIDDLEASDGRATDEGLAFGEGLNLSDKEWQAIREASCVSRFEAPKDLSKFAWLSIAVALVTIFLKGAAWQLTGSVGLLSDAAESLVNLGAAIVALIALKVSIRPPDEDHNFGHSKAEYFSAAFEGTMILIAASVIIYSAIERIIHPKPIENLGAGLVISVVASLFNGGVAVVLLRAGKKHRSPVLIADGRHLLTDVVTSAAVLIGIGLVWLTDINVLDPAVALIAGMNILWTGWKLLRDSTSGLMDVSLPEEDNEALKTILDRFTSDTVIYHAFRSRESGSRRFLEFHLLVPGAWTVQKSHDLVERITEALVADYPDLRVICHVEPIEDPASYEDILI